MNYKLFKPLVYILVSCFSVLTYGQKFDKKFTENFKTNKDVEIEINASFTDINVTTWNKNEVAIEAFIEIEGVAKEEAEKYFKNWKFEALGNNSKVMINSKGDNVFSFKNDFVFFDNMNFDFEMPDIDSATIKAFTLPEMDFNFDFDNLIIELESIGDNIGKDGEYNFSFNDGKEKVVIKSKEDWEKFKKSKKYAEFKKNISKERAKVREELAKSRVEVKKAMAEARKEMAKINKEEIKRELEKVRQELKNMRFNFSGEATSINGKKVKIKKRIEIKVPKEATFNLNTKHCKIKLPEVAASGNLNYGSFNAVKLNGGKLIINYAPVTVASLNACTLFLNNVTDAKIASVTKSTVTNNSSKIRILQVNNNVTLSSMFGDLSVDGFSKDFSNLFLELNQSNATFNLDGVKARIEYNPNRIQLKDNRIETKRNSSNLIKIGGSFSNVVIN